MSIECWFLYEADCPWPENRIKYTPSAVNTGVTHFRKVSFTFRNILIFFQVPINIIAWIYGVLKKFLVTYIDTKTQHVQWSTHIYPMPFNSVNPL